MLYKSSIHEDSGVGHPTAVRKVQQFPPHEHFLPQLQIGAMSHFWALLAALVDVGVTKMSSFPVCDDDCPFGELFSSFFHGLREMGVLFLFINSIVMAVVDRA